MITILYYNILSFVFSLLQTIFFLGTNDKAGGPHYVLRWTSPQSVKETFVPLTEWKYPYMD